MGGDHVTIESVADWAEVADTSPLHLFIQPAPAAPTTPADAPAPTPAPAAPPPVPPLDFSSLVEQVTQHPQAQMAQRMVQQGFAEAMQHSTSAQGHPLEAFMSQA